MNFSITYIGIIVAVGVPLLVKLGFSESCSNELINVVIPLIGAGIAAFGRFRAGGISALGVKK